MFKEKSADKTDFRDLKVPANMRQATQSLLTWYDGEKRDLPWRDIDDPYRVWLSEIMLQQTQVETVIGYFHRFLKQFPTVTALAEASEDEVLKQWEGLGYYSRARNLHAAAKVIAARGGVFPTSAEDWRELPGIGEYTSAAIASIIDGEPIAALDANLKRVFSRLLKEDPRNREGAKRVRRVADMFVESDRPGDVNQALMDLGSAICRTRGEILCDECPLRAYCRARRDNAQSLFPPAQVKTAKKEERYIVLIIRRGNTYAVQKRPARGMLAGLWQFPLLAVDTDFSLLNKDDADETDVAALQDKLREKVIQYLRHAGLVAESITFGIVYRHIYSHKIWQLLPCFIQTDAGLVVKDAVAEDAVVWRAPAQIKEELALIGACAPLVDSVLSE